MMSDSDSEIEPIVDEATGELRRCGSLAPPEGFVSSYLTFEEEHPLWDDSDILKAIQDPNRRISRKLFGDAWIANQLSFSSCNGWAAAVALSRARKLRGLPDIPGSSPLLSGSYVYSKINGGRDNGSMPEDGMKEIQANGAPPASLVTAPMIYPRLQPPNADSEAAKRKGLAAWKVQTKQGFRTALAAGFPVIIVVQAGNNWQKLNSIGIAGVSPGSGDHAVIADDILIVGGTEVYDQANHWGLSYGTRGRAYLVWDHFASTFNRFPFYAVGSTEEAGE